MCDGANRSPACGSPTQATRWRPMILVLREMVSVCPLWCTSSGPSIHDQCGKDKGKGRTGTVHPGPGSSDTVPGGVGCARTTSMSLSPLLTPFPTWIRNSYKTDSHFLPPTTFMRSGMVRLLFCHNVDCTSKSGLEVF